ncbi:copper resistance protein B [Thiogranum longum]|uniref:Copper resistance protein B n=1 Tax=Thiogranum longum TaxID=1537524 RepID=A0A4R1H861_9GAMM|nr:copper resistance protein B [Thiogranum longum]TCK18024.1 copper resistance protein B [Thiogranum longum]
MINRQATYLMTAVLVFGLPGVQAQVSTPQVKTPLMQGGSPPADARDPYAYSDGYDFGDVPRPRFADEKNFYLVLMDRLETVRTSDITSGFYDLQAWYGRDYDRAVLKAEGTVDSNRLEDASTELLWGHAVATYWDTQLGIRYDSGDGTDRRWLAFGVQGLAPYWFEVDATAYVGEGGRTAANLETTYDLLLTQKLILQPRIEADWYGKRDTRRGLGSGVSEVKAGLRLRYEVRRELAPYVGLEWARKYGDTKDFSQSAGQEASEARLVAGLRFWF